MDFPKKATGWSWTWVVLAGLAALTPCGAALAGDAPPKDAAGRLDAPALAALIDRAIEGRLAADKATLAPPADDAEFLRRAYLDITGVIPPADKAAAFLDSTQPDKRDRLIVELIARAAGFAVKAHPRLAVFVLVVSHFDITFFGETTKCGVQRAVRNRPACFLFVQLGDFPPRTFLAAQNC